MLHMQRRCKLNLELCSPVQASLENRRGGSIAAMTKPAVMATMTATPVPELVSVVMSNYRGARWLPQAIASVIAQSHRNLELIIVDDASGDDSIAVIRTAMAADQRISLIECPLNLGPAGARNLALDAASGDWIAVIDSDDLMHPARLARMVQAAKHLGCDGIADDMLFFGDTPGAGGRTLMQSLNLTAARDLPLVDFIASDNGGSGLPSFGYLKPLFRRSAMGSLRYDPTLRVGEDFEFFARLLARGASFKLIPDVMYLYRRHSTSLSHRLTTEILLRRNAAHTELEQLVPKDDPDLSAALRRRGEALTWALKYSQLVAAIKRGQGGAVFRLLSRHPRLVKPFWQSLRERVARNRDIGLAVERTPLALVLIPADTALPADVAATVDPGARWITVPSPTPPGAPVPAPLAPLAAELSDLSSRHILDVLAVGDAGLHAFGMVPHATRLRVWPETGGRHTVPTSAA